MQKFDNYAVFGVHDDNTLGQLRDVASRADRAALLADGHVGYCMPIGGVAAYREKVSVVGVGFDIACLTGGTPIVTRDGYHLPIERVQYTDPVTCWDGRGVRAVSPHMGAIPRGVKQTVVLRLANGRTVTATPDHEIWTFDGWRDAGALAAGERVACAAFVGLPFEADDREVPLALESEVHRGELARRGLYPLRRHAPTFPALLRMLAYVSGDGHLTREGKRVSVYTTVEDDAVAIERDFLSLGFEPRTFRRGRGPGRKVEIHVCVNSTALHALFAALGSPVGQKRWPRRPMPWLLDSPAWMRAHWLSSFASAEMMTPRMHPNGVIPNLQLKQAGEDRNAIRFIATLLESLGFEVSIAQSGVREGSRQNYVLQLLGGQREQLRFIEQVGFCLASEKRVRAAEVASVIWQGQRHTAAREAAKAEARELHAAGVSYREVMAEVADRFGVTPGFVYHCIYDRRGAARRLPGAAAEPDSVDEICWVAVESVEPGPRAAVYDVVTGDPAHCFFANGIVVHNCGNAAIRTDVTLQDFAKNPKHLERDLNRLADSIAATVSFGVGRKNRADDAPTDDPLFDDPAWDAVPAKERKALKDKARGQLGTVGSGNHYVDVFADRATGELWVGVHFGSRGFGHTVASNFLALGQGKKWGERAPEQEVLLDITGPIGEGYWALMNLAGRYAYAGREWVARKVVEMIGANEVELVHNHHNFCIPGDALVPTPDGPKRMMDVQAGDTVYAFDREAGLREATVTKHWCSGVKSTRTIRTTNRAISVTGDHPVLTVEVESQPHPSRPWHARRHGQLCWKQARDVMPGDILVCAEGYYATSESAGAGLARLTGAMLGDGWVRHETARQGYTVGLAIGTATESHTPRYLSLLENELPAASWRVDRPGAYGITCSSATVWREVDRLGLAQYSQFRRVPSWVFALPREEKLEFLSGYIDADGSVANDHTSNHGRAYIAAASRDLVEELREVAIACGLRVTLVRREEVQSNYGAGVVYRCGLSIDSVAELDLWHSRKSANVRRSAYRRSHHLSAEKIGYLDLPPGTFAQRVLAVEEGSVFEPVFDLTIDHAEHAFVCDGVVVHNCWKESHPIDSPDGRGTSELYVVRKGSTPAFPGQKGFVGGSMGDDAVILQGATAPSPEVREMQEAALFSTVHGAGRVMSRTAAAGKRNRRTGKQLSPGRISPEMMKEWLKEKNVILRGGGLDEAPQAYRRLPDVLAAQGPTVEVLHVLQPLIVVMAGADEFDPYKD